MRRSIRLGFMLACALAAGPVLAQVAAEAPAGAPTSASPAASGSAADSASASPSVAPSAAPPASGTAYAPIVLSPGVSTVTPALKGTEKAAPPAAERETPRGPWYGWQLLAADVVVAGTSVVLLRSQDEDSHLALFLGGSAVYLGVGPLLHVANGNGRNVVSSLIVRGTALLGGAAFGAIIVEGFFGCTERNVCKLSTVDFAAVGAGVGVLIGTIVDATWLGWKPAPTSAVSALRPDLRLTKGGATFGLAFAF